MKEVYSYQEIKTGEILVKEVVFRVSYAQGILDTRVYTIRHLQYSPASFPHTMPSQFFLLSS